MKRSTKSGLIAFLEAAGFFLLVGCFIFAAIQSSKGLIDIRNTKKALPTVMDTIILDGKLTVITRNTAHCYYTYRDQAMGFEYDLAKAFADYLKVNLVVNLADDWEGMIPQMLKDPNSLVAASLTITPERSKKASFSNGYLSTQQHIVVHRKNRHIRKPAHLSGQTVHIRRGTTYQETLEKLQRQGIDVQVVLHDDLPTEELIRRVAEKSITITVADTNIATLNRRFYPQVVISGAISEETHLGWAVSPQAPTLLNKINQFFDMIQENGQFKKIYRRYYGNVDYFDFVDLRTYHRRLNSRLPKYQPIIQSAAEANGFDWRLIAAQIYQESHFDPRAVSHAGALGLMQLTVNTAESLGVSDVFNPEENIHAGVRHLKQLYDYFRSAAEQDRLFLALAAYNVGHGHLLDARRLAVKHQLDPDQWSAVSKMLPLLSYRKYYKNSYYGYCRGREPIQYVKQTMLYYDILKHKDITSAGKDQATFPRQKDSSASLDRWLSHYCDREIPEPNPAT